MERRIFKGKWWIPSKPDDQIAGYLTIESNGVLKLELIGAFDLEERGIIFEREDVVIYGQCLDPNNHAKEITLFDCHSTITWNPSLTFPITRYICRYSLIGIHTETMSTPSFFKSHIYYDELTYWCPPQNMWTTWSDSEILLTLKTMDNESSILATVDLDDSYTLNLKESCDLSHPDYFEVSATQRTSLEVLKEAMSADNVVVMARNMERFLSFATLLPVEHTSILLFSKEKCQIFEKGVPYYHAIELVTFLYKDKPKKIQDHNFLFRHCDVADSFPNMLKRLYSNKSISLIWTMLLDSLETKRIFTSNDFLTVAQALDGFAKRFRVGKKVENEFVDLRNEFQDIERMNVTDEDIKEAVGSRNYYSHVLRLDLKEDKKAQDGLKLYDLMARLRVLLICCVMDFLGLDHTSINKILNNSSSSVLTPRIRKTKI